MPFTYTLFYQVITAIKKDQVNTLVCIKINGIVEKPDSFMKCLSISGMFNKQINFPTSFFY